MVRTTDACSSMPPQVYEAYLGSALKNEEEPMKMPRETFDQLCATTDSTTNRSFRVQRNATAQISESHNEQHKVPRHHQRRNDSMNKKTVAVYEACQSSPRSYRAKRQISRSINLKESNQILARNIEEYKAKLAKCMEQIDHHTVKVPAMRVLRNLIRKLYEADNYYMRSAFVKWKNFSDCLRQEEISARKTAKKIKSLSQELIAQAIATASKEAEMTIRRRLVENTVHAKPNVERWNRSKSMYNMTSEFKPRGSLFKLPEVDVSRYNRHKKVQFQYDRDISSP